MKRLQLLSFSGVLAIFLIAFAPSAKGQTKVRSNQINTGDTFNFTGPNTHTGAETFGTALTTSFL